MELAFIIGRVDDGPVSIVTVPLLFHVVVPVPNPTLHPVGVVDVIHAVFRNSFAAAYCTNPCELMKVALVVRVNVRRGSRTPVVKSSESVEPSPKLFSSMMSLITPRANGRWNRPRRLRIAGSDQRKE